MFENIEWGWDNARALLGIVAIFGVSWLLSESKRKLPWKIILGATAMQIAFALLLYGVPFVRSGLANASGFVTALQDATRAGTNFVFGYVGDNTAWTFSDTAPGQNPTVKFQARARE